jgi:hypothetical protein
VEKRITKPGTRHKKKTRLLTLFTDMLSSPAGEFVSELQTTEIPEGIMKHGVFDQVHSAVDSFKEVLLEDGSLRLKHVA